MNRQTPAIFLLVATIAGGVGFVAFVALMVVGDLQVSPAAFFAILAAAAAGVVMFFGAMPTGPRRTDRPMPRPSSESPLGNITREPGTAGVAAGAAGRGGAVAGTGVASDGEVPGDLPSRGSMAPDHTGSEAGAAPSPATCGMPDPAAGRSDAASGIETDHGLPEDKGAVPRAAAVDADAHTASDRPSAEAHQTGPSGELEEKAQRGEAAVAEGDSRRDEVDAAAAAAAIEYSSTSASASDAGGTPPPRLDAPHASGADDLQKINGIGPKLAETLNGMGFYHYGQIAGWSDAEIDWVESQLGGVTGRIRRNDWVTQAKALQGHG